MVERHELLCDVSFDCKGGPGCNRSFDTAADLAAHWTGCPTNPDAGKDVLTAIKVEEHHDLYNGETSDSNKEDDDDGAVDMLPVLQELNARIIKQESVSHGDITAAISSAKQISVEGKNVPTDGGASSESKVQGDDNAGAGAGIEGLIPEGASQGNAPEDWLHEMKATGESAMDIESRTAFLRHTYASAGFYDISLSAQLGKTMSLTFLNRGSGESSNTNITNATSEDEILNNRVCPLAQASYGCGREKVFLNIPLDHWKCLCGWDNHARNQQCGGGKEG